LLALDMGLLAMKPIIDISFYQNPSALDYDLIAANVSGVILRAAYGIWKDTAFDRHYQELAQIRGVPVGAYHYIIGSAGIQGQADAFNLAVGLKDMRLGCWIDVEDRRAGTRIYRQQVLDYAALQPDMGIYTSKSAWAEIMGGAYLTDRKLWVAHYTSNPYPLLPTGWDSWWLWQFTSTGRLPGYAGNLDTNRFYGDDADFAAWIGIELPEEPEPEPKLFDAKVVTTPPNRLRTRYTPNGNVRPESDWLQSQAIVPVYETHSTGWWRVAPEAWSSTLWMKRVGNEPPPITEKYYGALYWQRDPRWKDKPLGTSGTIGSYGCVMTAETNVLNQLGIVTNPVVNNAWRTANGGYHNGNLIVWEKVSEQHPDIIWEGKTWNPTDAQIKQKIAAGCPLVMLVDHNEGTPVLDEHWVNSIPSPADDDAIWIHDPWDNLTIRLRDRYKKPIQQFSSYRRQA
jgi:GH25 family lysozyme M1 (1,4-beta-N-acetylmuramidase)